LGHSYRSAIFYTTDEQRRIAEDTIADVNASGLGLRNGRGPKWRRRADSGKRAEAPDYLRAIQRIHLPLIRPNGS